MLAGDITIIRTPYVRRKTDGFLRVIMARLAKEDFKFEYFADGQGARWNLTNTKGQNQFTDKDTVIEISYPHQDKVFRYVDELHWSPNDQEAMRVIITLDTLQQAIGRNGGYRWSDSEERDRRASVVLCEPKLYKPIVKYVRYAVGETIDDPDTFVGLKKEYDGLVGGLCWYLRNFDRYITSGIGNERQAFRNDVMTVFKLCETTFRKATFKQRILEALKNKIGCSERTRAGQKIRTILKKIIDKVESFG